MKIKVKPKSFGPLFIHIDATGGLLYGTDVDHINGVNPTITSPADLLLNSLGSCIAISIRMAATHKQVTVNPFKVEVRATKAEDLPSRFGRFEIRIDQFTGDDPKLARELLALAKSICTVSNTLNAEIDLIMME